jgi:hypothetical protein
VRQRSFEQRQASETSSSATTSAPTALKLGLFGSYPQHDEGVNAIAERLAGLGQIAGCSSRTFSTSEA